MESAEQEKELMTKTIAPHLSNMLLVLLWFGRAGMAANGTSTMKQQEECRCIQEHCDCSDSAKGIKTYWRTFYHSADNDPKHTVKVTTELFRVRKWNILNWSGQIHQVWRTDPTASKSCRCLQWGSRRHHQWRYSVSWCLWVEDFR